MIEYYARIAPVMVPHLAGRCITLKRFPDGVREGGLLREALPEAPARRGCRTASGPGDRNGDIGYCRFDEPAALVWAANMAALELHVPMALAADLDTPRAVVFDFDPGAPAAIKECCEIALWVREVLAAVDLEGWCKTSGSKGLQLYVPLNTPCTHEAAADFALAVGQVLERQHRDRVTTVMAKAERPGKIFVDWSQNARYKTTIGVYSMRARPEPTVSTPVTWDEVEAGADGRRPAEVHLSRRAGAGRRLGDLFEPVLTTKQKLPVR